MDWPEIIIEGFPGPRDGEPPDLRGDITDELNDHLACAMQRELRRTDDPAVAEHAVLDRFGDPNRIARRLWWDAMKEQIMKDRIMIGMMILTLVICAVVGFFAWRMMQQGQQVNQAILAKLETLGRPVVQPELAPDLSKVTFRCFEENGQDKAAADLEIALKGYAFGDAKDDEIRQTTDAQGRTTFGPIQPGRYVWWMDLPGCYRELRSLTLYAGRIDEQIVNIPSSEMQADIALKADWPDDFKEKKVVLYASFMGEPYKLGGTSWRPSPWNATLAPDGTLQTGFKLVSVGWPPELPATSPFVPREPLGETRLALFAPEDRPVGSEVRLRHRAMSYRLTSLSVMVGASHPKQPSLRWVECARLATNRETEDPVFEARYGKDNTWTIDLPEELVKQVRENLPQHEEPLDMLTDIELRVAWPEDLTKRGFTLLCKFVPEPTAPEGAFVNQWWSTNKWMPLVRADGTLVWGHEYVRLRSRPSAPGARGTDAREPDLGLIVPEGVELQEEARTRRPARTYRLAAISVLAPTEDLGNPRVKWHRIAGKEPRGAAEMPVFVAEKDKLNTWTITLPEDLLREVREYLAAETQPASEPADVASPRAGRM